MGSSAAAGWVAHIVFWVLLVRGTATDGLSRRGAGIFALLWLAGFLLLPRIAWWTGPFVTSWTAILDVVLVFVIFKGDVRLT